MKTIEVPALARVEGEGGLYIELQNGKAVEIRLDIYEPPRFFPRFPEGPLPSGSTRYYGPHLRYLPVAYQMSSAFALENALGIKISPQVRAMRRLMYCGEYIENLCASHLPFAGS